MRPHYDRETFAAALAQVIAPGDVVFSHGNIGYFGVPEAGRSAEAACSTILGAFTDVLGDAGTLVVPTFTYSFCQGETFDPATTPSTCGVLTETLRSTVGARRSHDPIFSVAAVGRRAAELTTDVSDECFGPDSFWERLLEADGIVCNLNFDAGSTFLHYVERRLHVPYRFDKLFTGRVVIEGRPVKRSAVYFCRDASNPDTAPAFERFDRLARAEGIVRTIPAGRGSVVAIRARDAYALLEQRLTTEPWLLTKAGASGRVPALVKDAGRPCRVELAPDASPRDIVGALWRLPRDIVSDGYDDALRALASQMPLQVHEYPTGTRCWTWIIPEKWTCREAYVESLAGERIFSYRDNPLHVMSYSLPFDGVVSREELLGHLHVHRRLKDAVPFAFKYYERDWGVCCSQTQAERLVDERYRVRIDSEFSYGTLKVGEVVARGASDRCVVLCAHLCHPAMANDDLAGVAVGIEVMRRLRVRTDLKYTYRFLIVPETIGSVAYLSHHPELVPMMTGGLFLEMLGLDQAPVLQLSYEGSSDVDRCFRLAFEEQCPDGRVGAFRTVINNDERQFNAPGVRVPMLSLSRVLPRTSADWPFAEYHSSSDSIDLVSESRLTESVELVLRMVDTLEANVRPSNGYSGEIFMSRYGLNVDFESDPDTHKRLFDVLYEIDGTKTIAEIANTLSLPFTFVRQVVSKLEALRLVDCTHDALSRLRDRTGV